MKADFDTSVVIAGAGPVGLGLACELGLRGVDCLLIERRDGSVTVPKQSMVSSRNMEFCRRWGVASAVRNAVWPQDYPRDFIYLDALRGRELWRLKVPSYGARDQQDYTPEASCPCAQIYFDPILTARVRSFPNVKLRYHTALLTFDQDEAGVTARITDTATGSTESIRARYLVGCDGPAGLVRESLGIALTGQGVVADSVNIYFRSAALAGFHDKGWARFYRLIDESGCWSELIPIDGKELWRLTVFDEPASSENPARLLREMAGGDFAYEIISAVRWERRDFVAKHYGRGRVLIAGDAAHECSPTGGFGMHTGLEEAVNLGWKLAAVLEGWGGAELIGSYERERLPVARRNVEFATRLFHAITAIPSLSRLDAKSWEGVHGALSAPEHLKTQCCYDNSPICVADGALPPDPAPAHFVPSTYPGARAPHAWLADGRSTLDLFGEGFVLLRLGGQPPDAGALMRAARAQHAPLREIAIADQDIAELYERKLVLVRPDGHVAWRGDMPPADPAAVIARVRGASAGLPERADALLIAEQG